MNNNTLQNQESKELYCVYMHTCTVSGKNYIGQTVIGMHLRLNKHMSEVKAGSDFHFHRALRLYGEEAFISNILYVSFERDSKHLGDIEVQLIKAYDTYHNGYNSTVGGSGVGSGKDHPLFGKFGKDHPSYGKKLTSEACANMSASAIGNQNALGNKHTPEACDSIRAALIGNQNALGYKHTPEQRAKQSATKTGSNHPQYDHTIYTFEHKDGSTFTGTRYDFKVKHNLHHSGLFLVVKGTQKTTGGWCLVTD